MMVKAALLTFQEAVSGVIVYTILLHLIFL